MTTAPSKLEALTDAFFASYAEYGHAQDNADEVFNAACRAWVKRENPQASFDSLTGNARTEIRNTVRILCDEAKGSGVSAALAELDAVNHAYTLSEQAYQQHVVIGKPLAQLLDVRNIAVHMGQGDETGLTANKIVDGHVESTQFRKLDLTPAILKEKHGNHEIFSGLPEPFWEGLSASPETLAELTPKLEIALKVRIPAVQNAEEAFAKFSEINPNGLLSKLFWHNITKGNLEHTTAEQLSDAIKALRNGLIGADEPAAAAIKSLVTELEVLAKTSNNQQLLQGLVAPLLPAGENIFEHSANIIAKQLPAAAEGIGAGTKAVESTVTNTAKTESASKAAAETEKTATGIWATVQKNKGLAFGAGAVVLLGALGAGYWALTARSQQNDRQQTSNARG